MAINIGSFVYTGVETLLLRKKDENKTLACDLQYLVNFTLNDEQAVEFLRGGLNNPKLLTFYGDRDTSIECTTASNSDEILALMSNTTTKYRTEPKDKTETVMLSGGKFTLKSTPSVGQKLDVFAIGADGRRIKPALTLGTPATNESDYSIEGQTITCHSSVKRIKVFYKTDVEVAVIEAIDSTPEVYEMSMILFAQDVETKKAFRAWIEAPSVSIQPTKTFQGKNEASAPDPITLKIDMMFDEGSDYVYKMSFADKT